jgi:hypothetical protein
MNSGFTGQVGQESHLHPAVVEPHPAYRVVSDASAICRSAPLSLSSSAAACRQMSPCVGGHWGKYWGSLCFREHYSSGNDGQREAAQADQDAYP